jgi:steroid 5-alpha reductase family enzyme
MIIILSLIIALTINFGLFLVAYCRQSDKLTDFAYALSFMIVTLAAWLLSHNRSLASTIVVVLIFVWGIRLGGFLVMRIRKTGRDKRFDTMRRQFFPFLKFWLGQGFVAWLLLLPVLFMLSRPSRITVLFFVGFIIWLFGYSIESIADLQKFRFKQKATNNGRWIDEGVWRYSRHPNYFGEISIWAGMYLLAFSSILPLERVIGLVSPLAIYITLRFISGVPILERSADKRWGTDPKYRKYKATTPLLIPRWHIE